MKRKIKKNINKKNKKYLFHLKVRNKAGQIYFECDVKFPSGSDKTKDVASHIGRFNSIKELIEWGYFPDVVFVLLDQLGMKHLIYPGDNLELYFVNSESNLIKFCVNVEIYDEDIILCPFDLDESIKFVVEKEKCDELIFLENYPADLNVKQVAKILSFCEGYVCAMIDQHELMGVREGSLIKIPKERLIDHLCSSK